MRNLIRRNLLPLFAVAALFCGSQVIACPNCKLANETDSNRPRAYMYSILFMIGMPATIFTGFGISFYRMTRKARQAQAAEMSELTTDSET